MMEQSKECPLCGESMPSAQLQDHVEAERKHIRAYTISQIKTWNPTWVQDDGSCPRCLEHYAKL